jgi:hypothetical protein
VAGGIASVAAVQSSFSFTSTNADRDSEIDVAGDADGVLRLTDFSQNPVYQAPHEVTVTNNTSQTLDGNNYVTSRNGALQFRTPGSGSSAATLQLSTSGLPPNNSTTFEIVTGPNSTGQVTDTVTLSFESRSGLSVTVVRDITVEFKSGGQLVYAVGNGSGNGNIRVYDAVNDVVNDPPNSNDADIIGANAADIVRGSDADIPYLTKGGGNEDIFFTHVGASNATSVRKGNKPRLKKQKTRLTLSEWPPATLSGTLLLAADNNTSKILAFDSNGNDETLATPSNGCGGVAGVADIDGDGSVELVFVDSSQQMRYLEQNGNTVKIPNAGVGSNNSTGFGPPVDFDGDGTIEIPFIDGSQNPAVVTAGGNKTILNSNGVAKKAAIAPVDIDDDGTPELMFLGNSSGNIRYVDDVLGSNTVKTLQINGSPVTPLEKVGLNSGIDTQTGATGTPAQTPTSTPSGGCTVGSNNNPGAFQFTNLQGFDAKHGPDRWDIGQVGVQDADNDDDLNELKFEVTDGSSAIRATRTIQISGQQYQAQNLTITPDSSSYDVQKNETYTLTATVCDADGNSRTETRGDTA